jgi:hypothetical protein
MDVSKNSIPESTVGFSVAPTFTARLAGGLAARIRLE